MLTQISITNFALIEHLTLELASGLTVLTGETGAGKSMLLDAITLALGGRADYTLLRPGAERCEISLLFDVQKIPTAQQWLAEHELAVDSECIVRRLLSRDNRSRCFINGSPIPLPLVRELSTQLLDLHGQHEYQSLLKRDRQRDLLDEYAGHAHLCQEINHIYQRWYNLNQTYLALQNSEADRMARLTLLRYQTQELAELPLTEEEIIALDKEQRRLAHVDQLRHSCEQALHLLEADDQPAASDLLRRAHLELEKIGDFDPKTHNTARLLNEAIISMREASSELHAYLNSLELDAEHLQAVEQRLSQLHQLGRKHRVTPSQLPALSQQYSRELAELEATDQRASTLQPQLTALMTAYQKIAQQLTASRAQAAERLAAEITVQMGLLSMSGGKFAVRLEPFTVETIQPYGQERIEFLVSANPGLPLQSLAQVVSGGELSRISLAVQVILAHHAQLPTLIFDEVDVGIGGGTAETVGRLLRALGEKAQVICITHLPQVAAQGQHHFTVQKHATHEATSVQIEQLDKQQRVNEIARMLGGLRITKQTLAHAREMLRIMPETVEG
jgi:DNA repair protein RecN (Recombination protein N)